MLQSLSGIALRFLVFSGADMQLGQVIQREGIALVCADRALVGINGIAVVTDTAVAKAQIGSSGGTFLKLKGGIIVADGLLILRLFVKTQGGEEFDGEAVGAAGGT